MIHSEKNGKEYFDLLVKNTGLPELLISSFLKQLIINKNLTIEHLNARSIQNILNDEILKLFFEQNHKTEYD